MSEAEVSTEENEARLAREAIAQAAIDAENKAKADLAAAKKAHTPIAADDARRGARVKLQAGTRADTTDLPIFGTAKGTFGVILGDTRGGVANVEWEETKTWSAVDLGQLELVEEAPEVAAATPGKREARAAAAADLEARVAALEARLDKLGA